MGFEVQTSSSVILEMDERKNEILVKTDGLSGSQRRLPRVATPNREETPAF